MSAGSLYRLCQKHCFVNIYKLFEVAVFSFSSTQICDLVEMLFQGLAKEQVNHSGTVLVRYYN
jgi:hypothetical protein